MYIEANVIMKRMENRFTFVCQEKLKDKLPETENKFQSWDFWDLQFTVMLSNIKHNAKQSNFTLWNRKKIKNFPVYNNSGKKNICTHHSDTATLK